MEDHWERNPKRIRSFAANPQLWDRIERAIKFLGINRSDLIRRAVIEWLDKHYPESK